MIYTVGDAITVAAQFRNPTTLALTDPTALTFTVKAPDATTVVSTFGVGTVIAKDATGSYHASFTATAAGEWRYEWAATGAVIDAQDGAVVVQAGIAATAGTHDSLVPSVGAMLPARTYDTNGNRLGTFTEDTQPTRREVIDLLDQAAIDLAAELGALADLPASVAPIANSLLVLRAAMFIEMGFADSPVYARLEKTYDMRLAAAIKAVEQAGAGDEPGALDDELLPIYSFPIAGDPQVPTRQEVIDRWLAGGYGLGW